MFRYDTNISRQVSQIDDSRTICVTSGLLNELDFDASSGAEVVSRVEHVLHQRPLA